MNMDLVIKSNSGPIKAKIRRSDGSFILDDGSRLTFEGKGLARRISTCAQSGRIKSEWEILEPLTFPIGHW